MAIIKRLIFLKYKNFNPLNIREVDVTTESTTESISTTAGTTGCSALYLENVTVGRGKKNGIKRVENVQTVEDCQAECMKVRKCKFFVWNSPNSRTKQLSCFLKRNNKNRRSTGKDIGRISGPKRCDVD